MIIKRTRGVSAAAALAYDHGPGRGMTHADPRRVAGSVPGRDWHDRARIMQAKLRADGDTDRGGRGRVIRLAVSAAPGDRVMTDREWAQIAQRVVQEFTGNAAGYAWEAVRHDPMHVHITLLARGHDGRLVNEFHDFGRFGLIAAGLERDFGLARVRHDRVDTPERRRARTLGRQQAAAKQRAPRREHEREREARDLAARARTDYDGRERGREGIER